MPLYAASRPLPVEVTFIADSNHTFTPSTGDPTEWAGTTGRFRRPYDFTYAQQVRLLVSTASAPPVSGTMAVSAQYSTDGGTNWNYLAAGSPSTLDVIPLINVNVDSGWVDLVSGAKADVLLRPVTRKGDATSSMSWQHVMLLVR